MNCPICEKESEPVFDLPGLPFTDKPGSADQSFLFCECGHGFLKNIYPQESGGMGESHYLDVFADFVKKHVEAYGLVVDIGGGDGRLCRKFKGEYQVIDPSINCGIEDAYLKGLRFRVKLILSSHTLEHVADPNIFMSKVADCMNGDDVVALQVPSLELLVDGFRFDQVFHQHVHYFSERSLTALLAKHGLETLAVEFNPEHWGTLMVIAKKGKGYSSGRRVSRMDIAFNQALFKMHANIWTYRLREGFVVYGASPMLPVSSYYLPMERALFISDDDPNKEGLWENIPVIFNAPLKDRDVVIVAGSKSTGRKLMAKALNQGARAVYAPFQ